MTSQGRVLVVDDNEANRALAKATLEDEGFEIAAADSGAAAIRLFEESPPDCVLLDVRMPGMDGFATCAMLRALPRGPETPILFLTALRDLQTFDQAVAAGADDFLNKPISPGELLVRVRAALKARRMSSELREAYQLVKQQRDDLKRLQLHKEQLMGFVVHDLKNPVNNIDLHAQLLLRDRGLSSSSRNSAEHIRAETRALSRLILNLLDISRSEDGKLHLTPVNLDLTALAREVADSVAVTARARQVGVEVDGAPTVLVADPDLMWRILENLVDNSLRYAPAGSALQVRVAAQAGSVLLQVIDRGPGVPADKRDRVFDRYFRVDESTQDSARAGRGLGLAFCKLAVEAQGGRIWVDDGSPGAVFCVSLPRGRDAG
jgi:signal transduction histidine kinase